MNLPLTLFSSLPCQGRSSLRKPGGFALVSTISMMVILAVLAVALLSLSAISLKSSSLVSAEAKAKANARMALMTAIGELQKQLGPDQRISANSSILSSSAVPNPHWTGVWDSWIAGASGTASVNPNYPSAFDSTHQTIGAQSDALMHPAYSQKNRHFRGWLLSLNPEDMANISAATGPALQGKKMPQRSDTAVQLVADGSLGPDSQATDYVSARLIEIKSEFSSKNTSGRYAWWVSDESQKARIMDDSYAAQSSLTSAEKIFRAQAPASTGTSTMPGLESVADDTQLASLPSLKTLDLVSGVTDKPAQTNFHNATLYSYSVLADVREGGLKRDLSTILEQQIKTTDNSDAYILYRFDSNGQERVPIQDLAAYYQLYQDDPNWTNGKRGGVKYSSSALSSAIQVNSPDYGVPTTRDKYLRQYTALYTNPVPVKIQFLLAWGATPITAADRTALASVGATIRPNDTHKLLLGVVPVVTLWNPNNLPLVMNNGANISQVFKLNAPPFAIQVRKYRQDNTIYNNGYYNMNYAMGSGGDDGRAARLYPHIMQLRFANTRPIVFQPGEVKIFSLPANAGGQLTGTGEELKNMTLEDNYYEPVNEWDPYGFFVAGGSVIPQNGAILRDTANLGASNYMFFGSNDRITAEIVTEALTSAGRQVAKMSETRGGGFNFYLMDYNHARMGSGTLHFRNYQFMSRFGGVTGLGGVGNEVFNTELMTPAFPGGVAPIAMESRTDSLSGAELIGSSAAGEVIAFLEFSMAAGCEVGPSATGGYSGGRKFATRPFLHGATIAAPFIDQSDKASFYNYGWDWRIGRIDNVEDSIIQGDPGTGNGYYGGGYTSESGVTRVVQQDLPVVPPISIAALSHAHLGGFSLAEAPVISTATASETNWRYGGIPNPPLPDDLHRVTATGHGGLAPHVMQAIGNSYAHPNIPADKAFIVTSRHFNRDLGPENLTFADHSYLANKALWDEFFFSSIAPQPSAAQVFAGASRDASQVARDFFFGVTTKPLPNRRLTPYLPGLDKDKLDNLLTQMNSYTDGFADKIAAHLMVEGSFNVNSTSVAAWKTLLSSLKGKPVAYLDSGTSPVEATIDGVPVGPGSLPSGEPYDGIDDPNSPPEQWSGWRELSETEIDELATAIVKQVKARGPFLSMSEFVNRRLDSSNDQLAVKGALQAALDDPSVSINKNFRTAGRTLDGETSGISFAFAEAAKGPIAYGSAAYVDQADLLRSFAEHLTPRGDTFVIRSYGDAVDASGNVEARAWCEAVVQRTPGYVDSADESRLKQAALSSNANKTFGRKMEIVSFRWLNASEI